MLATSPPRSPANRRGLTIVEVLVAVAVLGMLAAILLPAIQAVRYTVRLATCTSHLHQVSVAALHFEAVHKELPGREGAGISDLLSHLEVGIRPNEPLPAEQIEVLICPDETHVAWAGVGNGESSSSFLMNSGSSLPFIDRPHGRIRTNGASPIDRWGPVQIRDITDGTSSSAMISERRFMPWNSQFRDAAHVAEYCLSSPEMCVFNLKRTFLNGSEVNFSQACSDEGTRSPPKHYVPSIPLMLTGIGQVYDHLITPNSPNCKWFVPPASYGSWEGRHWSSSASSYHNGGVNVAFCDGQVRFVSDQIDRGVWSAIGSINGGDSVSHP